MTGIDGRQSIATAARLARDARHDLAAFALPHASYVKTATGGPMHAFVERICAHILIVRAGPDAYDYGDPYEVAATCKTQDGWATVVGGISGKTVTLAHVRAMMRVLHEMGLNVAWEHKGRWLRRTHSESKLPIVVVPSDRLVVVGDKSAQLRRQEFELFRVVLRHEGMIVPTEQIGQAMFGHRPQCEAPKTRYLIPQLAFQIRKKLKPLGVSLDGAGSGGFFVRMASGSTEPAKHPAMASVACEDGLMPDEESIQ